MINPISNIKAENIGHIKNSSPEKRLDSIFTPTKSIRLDVQINDKSLYRLYVEFRYTNGSTFLSCKSNPSTICISADCNRCGSVRNLNNYVPYDADAILNVIKNLKENGKGHLEYILKHKEFDKDKRYSNGCLILYFNLGEILFNFEFTAEHGFYTDDILMVCPNINIMRVDYSIKRPKICFIVYRVIHQNKITPAFGP